jgi:DHA3 family macrolide efflux protein-like MFS transporter
VLIFGAGLGLIAGFLVGGRLDNLASVRLRWVWLIFAGLLLRFGTEVAIDVGIGIVDAARLPLFVIAFGALLIALWQNRQQPGLSLAFVGIFSNLIAISANGGYMPVWTPSLVAAGFSGTEPLSAFHVNLGTQVSGDFLLRAGAFGDIIPIGLGFYRNVASVGDLFLASGLAFFLFSSVVRSGLELDDETQRRLEERLRGMAAGTGPVTGPTLAAGLAEASVLDRPLVLGGTMSGTAGFSERVAAPPTTVVEELAARVRRHPYVRLALDSSFSALWLGQLVSMFGDRIHQIALAFLVFGATDSPAAVGAIFLVATLPNLLLGPLAGTFVDRWDNREVMIVSDLLRAALVLLIPVAAVVNLVLVYPLVFLVTTVSIFFRPAKGAILPRIVDEDDLLPANSALWVGETAADIVGYVLAGLFVAFLGDQLPLAFWVDAVTYVGSATLIGTIVVAPIARAVAEEAADRVGGVVSRFTAELREGWRFLRAEPVLLATTVQATVAQFMLGTFLALTPIYAVESIDRLGVQSVAAYSFIESGIGLGNLVGGFVIGLVGSRLALGRMVIAGYAVTGACIAALAIAGNLAIAVALAFGAGVGNLAFVIPSQTLFQRRTPQELLGRVLGLRFSLVFGSMTLAMGVGGLLAEIAGPAIVIGAFGLVTLAAGLAGLLVPAVRDA